MTAHCLRLRERRGRAALASSASAASASLAQEDRHRARPRRACPMSGAAGAGDCRRCSTTRPKDAKNWIHPNGNYTNSRYYPGRTDQHPHRHWRSRPHSCSRPRCSSRRRRRRSSSTASMFLTTSFNHVYAIDAATGEEYWHYKHKLGPIVDRLLRQQQPRRRGVGGQAVHGHDRREARRARRQDRQAAVGDADRRSRTRAIRKRWRPRVRRRQGADRHQRRRVRHPRLRQGVRCQRRQAAVDLLHDSRKGSRGRVGEERRHRPRHAPRHRRGEGGASPRTARSIRRSAAACG